MEEQLKKQVNTWRTVAIIAIALLVIVTAVFMSNGKGAGVQQNTEPTAAATAETTAEPVETEPTATAATVAADVIDADAIMKSWTEGAASKQALVSYMEKITDENSKDFIPVEKRIAVFDLDGTLFCETDPVYFDYCLLLHRVEEDPDYTPSEREKEVAAMIHEQIDTGKAPEGIEVAHGQAIASSFAGFTVQEFLDYVKVFRELPARSYEGMTIGDGFYQPMVELVDYLQKNLFTVFIVSGTDRLIVRGIVDGKLDIPDYQIIGSDETIVASGQEGEDGLEYVYTDEDQLVLGGDFIVKNLKMNKVSVIMQEIGEKPVLSFGNSTGDSSMCKYVTSNNPYPSMAFMLCCDDTVRENGSESKAEKMVQICEENGWVPVSMKNDWTTIYGEGVTRKAN